jgi:hypothetical protein
MTNHRLVQQRPLRLVWKLAQDYRRSHVPQAQRHLAQAAPSSHGKIVKISVFPGEASSDVAERLGTLGVVLAKEDRGVWSFLASVE